jgi:hypothetical protein
MWLWLLPLLFPTPVAVLGPSARLLTKEEGADSVAQRIDAHLVQHLGHMRRALTSRDRHSLVSPPPTVLPSLEAGHMSRPALLSSPAPFVHTLLE